MIAKEAVVNEILRDLTEDELLQSLLAEPAEAMAVSFQKSETISFVAVLVAVSSDKLSRQTVDRVMKQVVKLSNGRLEDEYWWGIEILFVTAPDQPHRKILRVMLPKSSISSFRPEQVGQENRNFAETQSGVIWYEGQSMLTTSD